MSDNWVVQNLENALATWNEKLAEIWQLITQSPEQFKGGTIWNVVLLIHDTMQAIGLALLVLFFVVGVVKTCGSFAEIKRPEAAVKLFIRFALAKAVVTYGLELMMALFTIVQGVISSIMSAAGMGAAQETVLPAEIVSAIESCGFWESIPLWAVALIGGLFITILSFVMVLTVYGRFFRLYIYTAIAPIPLSTFAGEPSQQVGKSFLKSYAAVCLEGAIIVLACIIFSLFASSPPAVDPNAAAVTQVWTYVVFQNPYSADFFDSTWRRFRKRGAYPTAITQNVEYLLDSVQASTMLSNSEMLILLNQAPSDREKLAALLNISPEQTSYITNAPAGCGLLRYGGALVPFRNQFPKDTELYRLMTTKPDESIIVGGKTK